MRKKNKKYEEWHKLCWQNRKVLKEAGICVCFDCFTKFEYEYLNDGDWTFDECCICPFCSVDSVIPAVIDGYELTEEDLISMSKYWFGE